MGFKSFSKISTILNMLYIFCDCCGNYCYFGQKCWKITARNQIIFHIFSFKLWIFREQIVGLSLPWDGDSGSEADDLITTLILCMVLELSLPFCSYTNRKLGQNLTGQDVLLFAYSIYLLRFQEEIAVS